MTVFHRGVAGYTGGRGPEAMSDSAYGVRLTGPGGTHNLSTIWTFTIFRDCAKCFVSLLLRICLFVMGVSEGIRKSRNQ